MSPIKYANHTICELRNSLSILILDYPAPINWVKGNPLPKPIQLNFHALAVYVGILNFTPRGLSSTLNFVLIAIPAILVFQVHFNVEFANQAVNFS